VRQLETFDEGVRLYVDEGSTAIPQILRTLDGAGIPLRSIELHRPSLDDVFLTKTGRSLRES
jgi:ABC-2 type transport system ATP-binding protein